MDSSGELTEYENESETARSSSRQGRRGMPARSVTFIRSLHMAAFTILRPAALLLGLCALPLAARAQTEPDRTQDRVAYPAYKIIGNVNYVGTVTLNSYLITTPQGHIVINSNFEDTVPLLRASVEKLGFKMTDIKIILGSHAHPDHQQADALVKEVTGGAMVMAMEQDVPALKAMKAPSGKPHPIDRILKDGEQVTLGGTTLTAHLTPGHTPGCTTWTTRVPDGGRTYDVLVACAGLQEGVRLVNNKTYPAIAEDFAKSIKTYQALPADVFLGAHSWFFDLDGKYKKLGSSVNPYIDPAGYKAWVDNQEKNYNALLAEQKKNPPAN
jgi:metallo-beta-lactamase class B